MPENSSMTSDAVVGYSIAERDRRWGLTRDFLDAEGLDALIAYGDRCDAAGPPQFCPDTYLTNERPGATVIFPRVGDPVMLLWAANAAADHLAGERSGYRPWIAASNLRSGRSGEALLHELERLGLSRARIGVLGLERYGPFFPDGPLPYTMWQTVVEGLPHARLSPVWKSFSDVIIAKSEEEIAVLRHSAAAGERMTEAVLEVTRPGVSEAELYAAANSACFRAGANSHWIILVSGPEHVAWGPPAWTYRPTAPRTIEDGDVVIAEFFPTYGMQETQQQVTIAVGDVHPDIARCEEATNSAYQAGLEILAPGVRFGEVADAMAAPILDIGGWNQTPHIHTLNPFQVFGAAAEGLSQLPGMDRYEGVSGAPGRDSGFIIRDGMSFAYQPNCSLGAHRVNLGGTVVVTSQGVIELNTLPNRMHHVS